MMIDHTVQDDFEHYIAYSNLGDISEEERAIRLHAYNAAWEPSKKDLSDEIEWIKGQFKAIMLYTKDSKIAIACAEAESKLTSLKEI